MLGRKQEINPIQPVAVVTPIEMVAYPPPYVPTWLEKHILFPLEEGAKLFLKAVIILLAVANFLDTIGLLP